jgi:hypothetical protein
MYGMVGGYVAWAVFSARGKAWLVCAGGRLRTRRRDILLCGRREGDVGVCSCGVLAAATAALVRELTAACSSVRQATEKPAGRDLLISTLPYLGNLHLPGGRRLAGAHRYSSWPIIYQRTTSAEGDSGLGLVLSLE